MLALKDGMTGFCELVLKSVAKKEVTVQALMDWFKRYGVVLLWVSDQISHLNNEVREKVWKVLAAQHYFVTAYHPCQGPLRS